MKTLKALCSILVLSFMILFITSCNEETTGVTGDFTVTLFKTAVEVNTTYVDSLEHELYNDNLRSYIVVENTDEDGETTEVTRAAVTIVKPTVADKDSEGNPIENPEIPREMTGNKVTISNLTEGTEYTLKLIVTANKKQFVLKTKTIVTLDTGENEKEPIVINTLQELVGMNKDNDAYYKLGADIVIDGTLATVFNSSTIFKGHFDGDGHTISGYTIASNNYAGLFGNMYGATVKNLKLKDVKYETSRGEMLLGALSGYAKNCTIENVTVENFTVTYSGRSSSTAVIGGLVGEAENSTITNCYVKNADIKVNSAQLRIKVGGFVGVNDLSLIDNCSVDGKLYANITYNANTDGALLLGGFVGVNDSNKGVNNSTAKVNIEVVEPSSVTSSGVKTFRLAVGGFAGANETYHNKLLNCVAFGDIKVSALFTHNVFVGGIVGDVSDAGVALLENCVYKAKENGIKVSFMKIAEDKEQKDIEQTAYVSLTVGRAENNAASITNVIAYNTTENALLVIENEHLNVVITDSVESNSLEGFNAAIKNFLA